MTRLVSACLLTLGLCAHGAEPVNAEASAKAVEKLSEWLSKPAAERATLPPDCEKIPLTKADAATAAQRLWDARVAEIRATRAEEMSSKVIHAAGKEMKFDTVSFGDPANPPTGGRALFISMHGGGGAPPRVNESQWVNQVKLGQMYKPAEGLYVAPRAPSDTWNLWHEGHIDALFARLIEDFVVFEKVNPNKVYVMGYSAGGDGVYQLTPRMSDFWAGAAMSAGHPNETKPIGLRNVPFALQVGELDGAYNRNKVAADFGKKLDDLRTADPEGYEHFTELHKDKPHWMGGLDRKAIPWMEKFTRNPVPSKIAWRQDDRTHTRSYWLAVPKEDAKGGREIFAQRADQKFTITTKDYPTVTVLLNDAMANLDAPLNFTVNEKEQPAASVTRTIATLARTLEERGDKDLMFSAEVTLKPELPPKEEKAAKEPKEAKEEKEKKEPKEEKPAARPEAKPAEPKAADTEKK
jgi:hypothetical protein